MNCNITTWFIIIVFFQCSKSCCQISGHWLMRLSPQVSRYTQSRESSLSRCCCGSSVEYESLGHTADDIAARLQIILSNILENQYLCLFAINLLLVSRSIKLLRDSFGFWFLLSFNFAEFALQLGQNPPGRDRGDGQQVLYLIDTLLITVMWWMSHIWH